MCFALKHGAVITVIFPYGLLCPHVVLLVRRKYQVRVLGANPYVVAIAVTLAFSMVTFRTFVRSFVVVSLVIVY